MTNQHLVCPPLVFGPIVHYLNDLKALNTSNQRVRDFMAGAAKEEIPETGMLIPSHSHLR